MFYLLAIGSMLGYTVQNVLLVRYARQMDGLSFAFYRNISFCITLLPLCIGSTPGDVALVFDHWHLLAVSAFMGGCSIAISCAAPPLLSGYFWETSIAVACIILLLGRWVLTGQPLQNISVKTFLMIALCASPTLIGTGLFALATRIGPVAIVGAVGSASLVFTALLAWLLYKEPLRGKQWLSIAAVMGGIALLPLV